MLPDIQPGNTKILYFFNCLLDGMHTILFIFVTYLFHDITITQFFDITIVTIHKVVVQHS